MGAAGEDAFPYAEEELEDGRKPWLVGEACAAVMLMRALSDKLQSRVAKRRMLRELIPLGRDQQTQTEPGLEDDDGDLEYELSPTPAGAAPRPCNNVSASSTSRRDGPAASSVWMY
jgi:hypothetical protein